MFWSLLLVILQLVAASQAGFGSLSLSLSHVDVAKVSTEKEIRWQLDDWAAAWQASKPNRGGWKQKHRLAFSNVEWIEWRRKQKWELRLGVHENHLQNLLCGCELFFSFFSEPVEIFWVNLPPVWFLCWNPSGFRISWKDPKLSAECELRSCQQLGHEAVKLELLDYELWKWCDKVNFKIISRYLCKLGSWFAQCCSQLCGSSGSSGARVSWFFPAFRTLRTALSWMISGWSWGLSRCYRSVWSNWNCEMNCRRGVHRRCTKLYPGIPVSSKTWRHARVWAMVKSEVGLDPGRPINDIVSNSTGTEQKISWGLCKFRVVSA